jgi:Holliday junction resolvase RusA-like endonuclease
MQPQHVATIEVLFDKPQPAPRPRARKMPTGKFMQSLSDPQLVFKKCPECGQHDTRVQIYMPSDADDWTGAIVIAARHVAPLKPMTGPIQVDWTLRLARPGSHFRSVRKQPVLKSDAPMYPITKNRHDRDNHDKSILDALTKAWFWEDDAQAVTGTITKRYCNTGEKPGVQITILSLPSHVGGVAQLPLLS